MSTIKRQVLDIPLDQVKNIDELFGQMMKIDINDIPRKFKKGYALTREIAYGNFTMSCIIESYPIKTMDSKGIILENGVSLHSELLPDVFKHAFELGFFVATLYGYDDADAEENNILNKLFLDNWGTAFIERGDKWAIQSIAKELKEKEIYITHSFSPGQNNIPIEMQTALFNTLDPSEIGVSLSEKYMMYPKKSVSGIFGIQTVDENRVRPCDLCERRDTCPTAYA